jgi:tRNA threonylcarbamoyladenosine biosynthesis protein TsaB
MAALIAFDTATERMSIAVKGHDGRVWSHDGEGGAKASAALLPGILGLLEQAGLALADLDAIAFGRGPGAFTGLRTACSVAQGLAFGAGKRVLPIDSLLAVAEEARAGAPACRVWAVMDARMAQIYAAEYEHADGRWRSVVAPLLTDCEALALRWQTQPPQRVAGDALHACAMRLPTFGAALAPDARPGAVALLALAEVAWAAGAAVDPAEALPLYVRDKVAQTTLERDAARLQRAERV